MLHTDFREDLFLCTSVNKGKEKERSPDMQPRLLFSYWTPSPKRGLGRPWQGAGEGLDLLAFNDCFSSGLYRRFGTHLFKEIA